MFPVHLLYVFLKKSVYREAYINPTFTHSHKFSLNVKMCEKRGFGVHAMRELFLSLFGVAPLVWDDVPFYY